MTINLNHYKDKLLFVPLGGSGEIGLNLNLYQYDGKWIMVDLGAGFADDYLPGVQIIVPNIDFLAQIKDKLLGIVLTHAHEDHVGAINYLWDEIKAPMYATPFTANFIKAKFVESVGSSAHAKIKEVPMNTRTKIGPFDIEMVSLNHSAPEMQALFIRTEGGNIFHTGDWKFDHDPVLGSPNDEALLKQLGDEGVDILVGDSTNIFNDGFSGSEGDLAKSLEKLILDCKGLVTVTTFASNLARLETIIRAAQVAGRKIVVSGRSIWRVIHAARDAGYLQDAPELMDDRSFGNFDRRELLLICTGCQGEPLAATTKIATGNHQSIRFVPGDTVIFSSKIIPGNDKAIFRLFNMFVKQGVEVLTERDHFVHVSGHPARGELKKMYTLLRPKTVIPVHGELIHMHEHAKFARSIGVPHVVEVENGDLVLLGPDKPEKLAVVEAGRLAVDGYYLIPSNSPVIKMRRRLKNDGIVVCVIIVDKNYHIINHPVLKTYGVIDDKEERGLIEAILEEVVASVETRRLTKTSKTNLEDFNNNIRSVIKRFIEKEVGKSPVIELHLERM
ncbi:MAG: ribonuclease J [Sphingobacteriia bacterium]|nr:ribonuclease J [Sphingobacteriia bacterium]